MAYTEADLARELVKVLTSRVADAEATAALIVEAFAEITPSKVDADDAVIELIRITEPFKTGVTIKPGNIRLNWKKLFKKMPELVLTGAGVTQAWLVPFAALYLWNLVWSLAKIEISPDHGSTMYALWNTVPARRKFAELEALKIVNRFRAENAVKVLNQVEFAELINGLVTLECVELENGEIWLREWIRKSN